MATLQSGKCFTVPTFFGMCCRSEWQERMYIYKWHEVDQTKHEIFCVHFVCNEIQVKVNLEITTFLFYLRFPYCPNFFWFGVVKSAQATRDSNVTSGPWRTNDWKYGNKLRFTANTFLCNGFHDDLFLIAYWDRYHLINMFSQSTFLLWLIQC